jgi:hypothetical protein
MKEIILNGLKGIAEAWKGILAISGIIAVIATVAINWDHWKAKNVNADKSLIEVKAIVAEQGIKLDSILLKINDIPIIKKELRGLKTGQNNIVDALANHMSKDKSVTKQDLLDFMRQFQMEQEKKNSMTDFSLTQ